jgi:hypothetical protein
MPEKQILDLEEPAFDRRDPVQGVLLFLEAPGDLQLEGGNLELVHVPLGRAKPAHGRQALELGGAPRVDSHG